MAERWRVETAAAEPVGLDEAQPATGSRVRAERPARPVRLRFRARFALLLTTTIVALTLAAILPAYQAALDDLRVALGGQLIILAGSCAIGIDGDQFATLTATAQMGSPAYRRVQDHLRRVRLINAQLPLRRCYTLRPEGTGWVYVVDSAPREAAGFSALGVPEPAPPQPAVRDGLVGLAVSARLRPTPGRGAVLIAAAPIRDSMGRAVGVVVAEAPVDSLWSLAHRFRRLVGWGVALVVLLSALLAHLVARGLTRPIRLLIRASESVARGEPGPPLPVPANDELSELVRVFQHMAGQVRVRELSLQQAKLDTLYRLALAAEFKDTDTAAHIQRMSLYAGALARRAGLPPAEVELIRLASPMHDVGKLGVPDAVLLKPGPLTEAERTLMQEHTVLGARLLTGSPSELLQAAEVIALSHHERFDGSGYPFGLAGRAIPLWGRICAIADVYDALTSARPYKPPFAREEAARLMRQDTGHFDPRLLELFLADLDELEHIRQQHRDDELGPPPTARVSSPL